MRKFGVMIPDAEMVRMSTLSRKNEIAKQLEGGPSEEEKAQQQLQIETMKKTIEELESKVKAKDSETLKQVTDVAQIISDNPKLAPLIDVLMGSLGKEESEVPQESQEYQEGPKVSPQPVDNSGVPKQLGQINGF